MMNKIFFACAVFSMLSINNSQAADDIFGFGEEEMPQVNTQNKADNTKISSFLVNKITEAATRNIENAEKVFCYTVEYAKPDYNGYLIDDMAVTGSCGELSDAGKQLLHKALFANSSIFSNNIDNCTISPKVVFRYIYGPDHTDVLLSNPCSAAIFFHGRDVITVNAAPGKEIIEKISKAYTEVTEKYLSPALLGQMVPNGQIINQTQKEMIRRINSSEKNLKKWGASENNNNQNADKPAATVKKGWNKLK